MESAKALVYKTHGKPGDVLELEERPLPEVEPEMVKLKMLASTIHPSDFGMIGGSYGRLKELPAVAGREGVAEVIETGSEVIGIEVGDRVRMPESEGVWQSACVVPAKGLFSIPKDVPVEAAATAMINPPTAWRLLRDADLNDNDWIVQNAANSAVGMAVIQMARHLNLKTLNIVRREELIEPLKKMGADVVVLEDSGYEKQIADLTENGHVMLALNSVGGESAIRLIKSLSTGGLHVTFGAMSFEPVKFPTRFLIFHDVTMKGFWLDKWYRENSETRLKVMFDKIFDLMRKEIVYPVIDKKYSLEDYQEAIARASEPRFGKVLFTS